MMNDNDDFSEKLKKGIQKFQKDLKKKIKFDPETEELVGIHFEDFQKVHRLDTKLQKRYDQLRQLKKLIADYEKDIEELNEKYEIPSQILSEVKQLKELIELDKKELKILEDNLKTAQNYDLTKNELLDVGFLNPSDEEEELKELRKLVIASAKFLLKLCKLKNLITDHL